jgi:hypothetical protein
MKYAIRIPANENLERDVAELLPRPVGRPSHKPIVWYKGFLYKAASWNTARRVVAKVEHHAGELFPRIGFAHAAASAAQRLSSNALVFFRRPTQHCSGPSLGGLRRSGLSRTELVRMI